MKVNKSTYLLYGVTDATWLGEQLLEEQVEQAIQGGATFIQLREKELPYDTFLTRAKKIKAVTDRYKIPFVVNDHIDIAIACDADGVHIGQDDGAVCEVRKLLGTDKIIGVSVQTIQQAIQAENDGADYVGVGAIFPTETKKDAKAVSFDILQKISETISIPVVAIGGINEHNVLQLRESGIAGVAVISAIFAKSNIMEASQNLSMLVKQVVKG